MSPLTRRLPLHGDISIGVLLPQPWRRQTFAAAVAVVSADVLAGAVVAVAVVALVVLVDPADDVELATVAWTTCPSALKMIFTSVPRGSYLYVFSMSPPERVFASPVKVMF